MATHSSISAWKAPWAEGAGGLQSMGPQRVDMAEHIPYDPAQIQQCTSFIHNKLA